MTQKREPLGERCAPIRQGNGTIFVQMRRVEGARPHRDGEYFGNGRFTVERRPDRDIIRAIIEEADDAAAPDPWASAITYVAVFWTARHDTTAGPAFDITTDDCTTQYIAHNLDGVVYPYNYVSSLDQSPPDNSTIRVRFPRVYAAIYQTYNDGVNHNRLVNGVVRVTMDVWRDTWAGVPSYFPRYGVNAPAFNRTVTWVIPVTGAHGIYWPGFPGPGSAAPIDYGTSWALTTADLAGWPSIDYPATELTGQNSWDGVNAAGYEEVIINELIRA